MFNGNIARRCSNPRSRLNALGDRPTGGLGGRVGLELDTAPGVDQQAVGVVARLAVVGPVAEVRSAEQHGQRAGERLDVVINVAERVPHGGRGSRLSAEPRPGGLGLVNHEPPS
jgi:hypothetical protein